MSFLDKTVQSAIQRLPEHMRGTWSLRIFALTQVPMILFCMPSMEELTDAVCAVRIPLNRRTRNHFKSMYFGALAVGADVAGGFLAQHHISKSERKVGLIFKSFEAKFLRRPEADVVFRSEQGVAMAKLVQRAIDTGERVDDTVDIVATTPDISGDTPVATFRLVTSLKLRT